MDIFQHSNLKNTIKEKVYKNIFRVLTFLLMSALLFVIYYICKEALPIFSTVSLKEFLLGTNWMPIEIGDIKVSFGIKYFILGTLLVSFVAILISMVLSIGTSIFLAFNVNEHNRKNVFAIIDLISGVPSVVFGFVGLDALSPIFFKLGVKTGNCVLLASIILSIMIIPFMVSSLTYTFLNVKSRYYNTSLNLGVDKWYTIAFVIVPANIKSIFLSVILANCRALGETMAVLMVIGNAQVFPKLLGKGETIATLIALEMGTAVHNSPHYHALYASGLLLLIMVFFINIFIHNFIEKGNK